MYSTDTLEDASDDMPKLGARPKREVENDGTEGRPRYALDDVRNGRPRLWPRVELKTGGSAMPELDANAKRDEFEAANGTPRCTAVGT